MSQGLWKLHHAAQTIEARKDFAKLVTIAKEQGKSHLAIKHMYPEDAGWRVIDKHLKRLREALAQEQPYNDPREETTTCSHGATDVRGAISKIQRST